MSSVTALLVLPNDNEEYMIISSGQLVKRAIASHIMKLVARIWKK